MLYNNPTLADHLHEHEQRGEIIWNKCLIHLRTSVLGRPLRNSKLCECCGFFYQKQQLDVLFTDEDTFYLGPGLSSYFLFIKSCICLMLFCTLLFSVPNITTNLISRVCLLYYNVAKCLTTKYIQVSVANKVEQSGFLMLQSYLAAATVVGMILGLQYARKKAADLEVRAEVLLSQADFAVMMRLGIGQEYTERDVREGIQEWWDSQQDKPVLNQEIQNGEFPVEKVVLSFKISEFEALQKERTELKQYLKKMHKSKSFKNSKTKKEIEQKGKRLTQIQKQLVQKQLPKNNKCIIIFRYPQQQQFILEKHENTLLRMLTPSCCINSVKVGGNRVTIRQAALPSEINWHNHAMRTRKKHIWRLFILLVCVILVAAAEGAVFGLLYLTFKKFKTGNPSIDEYISPTLSLTIGLINTILYRVLTSVSRFQYRATNLEDKVSIARKIVISIFLNSGVMLLFAYFMLDLQSVWVPNGFIDTMTFSYLMVTFMPHVMNYVMNLDFYFKLYKWARLKCSSDKFTQKEANEIYQRPTSELYEKYAWMINLTWWASIFAPMIPISYPCALLSLFIHYWSEKFQYVALIKQPKPFGTYLNTSMLKVLEAAPFFLAAGNLVVNLVLLMIRGQVLSISVVSVDVIAFGVSFGIFLIPTRAVMRGIQWVFCIKKKKEGIKYSQAKENFITTYEKENPVYRQEALKQMRDRKQGQKAVSNYNSQPQYQQIEMQPLNNMGYSMALPYVM